MTVYEFFALNFFKPLFALLPAALWLGGCASNPQSDFDDVQRRAGERTGKEIRWNLELTENAQFDEKVAALLKADLTVNSAVQVALLNNRSLQSEFEAIGISHADLVQAGKLKNPEFFASWRFPNRSPSGTDAEYSITEDFLDLALLPLRKKIAAQLLEQTKLQVTHEVVSLAAETRKAFFTLQARQQLARQLELIAEAGQYSAEIARRQHEAGTLNELEMAGQQALAAQGQVELLQARAQIQADRERLNRLMGAWGANLSWKIATELPPIPDREIPLEKIESFAISNRLDLQAAHLKTAAAERALKLRANFRYAPAHIDLGVDTEQTPDRQHVTGPTLELDLPLFDQGQGEIGRLQARYRQARRRTEALAINIRSEVREAANQLQASRELALYLGRILLPQRRQILELTQQHYNAMLKGIYELLFAKQNEIAARRAYTEAWRDYWLAHAELERAAGGMLPAPAPVAATNAAPLKLPAGKEH